MRGRIEDQVADDGSGSSRRVTGLFTSPIRANLGAVSLPGRLEHSLSNLLANVRELRAQIRSVSAGAIPPAALRDMPEVKADVAPQVDMVKAAEVDPTNEASSPS